jgi:uncharacterized membrane protein YobD (UPF0266 family)
VKELNPYLAIAIMILGSVIASVLTALYVSLYNLPIYTILALAGSLPVVGGAILGFEIHRQNKKLEKMDKGRKILEIKQRGIEILPKSLKLAMVLICCILAFGIIVNAITGNNVYLPLISVLIANLVIFASERRYEIYEKGIRYGMVFIKWDEIRDVEWDDGILEIKTGKVLGCIRIRDEDGNVKNIVEKYTNGE